MIKDNAKTAQVMVTNATCKGGGIGAQGPIAPQLFQICELRGLASHRVKLGTLACNTTQI